MHFFFGLAIHAAKSEFGIARSKEPYSTGTKHVPEPHGNKRSIKNFERPLFPVFYFLNQIQRLNDNFRLEYSGKSKCKRLNWISKIILKGYGSNNRFTHPSILEKNKIAVICSLVVKAVLR